VQIPQPLLDPFSAINDARHGNEHTS
jgi:hypothetical protein